jgi:hypothetical protein
MRVALTVASLAVLFIAPLSKVGSDAAPTTTTTVASSCPRTVSEDRPVLPPKPTGIIAYDIYAAKQGTDPFPPQILDDPSVSGLDLAIGWNVLEPDVKGSPPGTPTPIRWSVLDCLFSEGDQHGKFVVLTLIPGFHTPSWALASVPTQLFSFAYHEPPYPPKQPLPMPWNQVYLGRWFSFLQAVANRYDTNPEFRMVAADGPTSLSGEMTLPFGTGDPAFKHLVLSTGAFHFTVDGSDVAMWEALGYTPDLLEGAWAETFDEFTSIFHDKYVSLALIGGLPIGNRPTSTGPSLVRPSPPDPAQSTATPLTIIREGRTHRSQFVLQDNGLSATQWPEVDADTSFNFVQANCASVATGFQTKLPGLDGSVQDDIDKGVHAGVGFLELYVKDILDASASELATAKSQLTRNPNCDPITLSAVPTSTGTSSMISITASTTLDLHTGDTLNIVERGKDVASCHTSTCHVTVQKLGAPSTFSADVSYAGQPPLVQITKPEFDGT